MPVHSETSNAPNKRNKLIILISIFLFFLVVAVIVLSTFLAIKKNETSNVCTTTACINAANMILKNVNTSIDPCEDFNQFSCGSFIKNTRIPDDQTAYDVFTYLRTNLAFSISDVLEESIEKDEPVATKNAKILYRSCLNETIIELIGENYIKEFMKKEFGGSSLLGVQNQINDPVQKLVKFHKYSIKPIFNFDVSIDRKTPDTLVLSLNQPSWLFSKEYYDNENLISAYRSYAKTIFSNLNPQRDQIEIEKEVNSMIELEIKFGKTLYTQSQRRNETPQTINLEKLQLQIPDFNWMMFIKNGIFGELKGVNLTDSEPIQLSEYGYLVNATKIYLDAFNNRKKDLDNLLIWSFLKDRTNLLPKVYKNARLEFDKVYTGANTISSRSKTCANVVTEKMPYAVGRLYVAKNFDSKAKQIAEEMIENIRKEFIEILKEVTWMDEESRSKALEKAYLIDSKIGYPEYSFNNTYLNILYEDYLFDEQNYAENTVKLLKISIKESFGKLREKIDRKDWISGPAIVNAFYSPSYNQICFPAGILQAPFYDAQSPNYLNYGGIGSVIGHEITHGFDDQGRTYDKNGVNIPDGSGGLWSESTIKNYKERAQCIIDQYSNYKAEQVNMNLNGFQTQGENIADNGGIKEAFRAYKKWSEKHGPEKLLPGLSYSQNQLFFINYAQVWCAKFRDQALISRIKQGVHSPGGFRIIGPTSNYEEFSKVFNCKPNQKNNPKNKCAVW